MKKYDIYFKMNYCNALFLRIEEQILRKDLNKKENYKFKKEILEDINRFENYRLKND